MQLKEIFEKGLWEKLEFSDSETTEEERVAKINVMKKANLLKAVLNKDQISYFTDYVVAVANYLQASKKSAFERGVNISLTISEDISSRLENDSKT